MKKSTWLIMVAGGAFLLGGLARAADESAGGEPGRSLEDILQQGVGDQGSLEEARALIERLDAATEDSVRRVLSLQVGALVRRNLQVFTQAAQGDGPDRRLAIRALTLAVAPDTVELMISLLDAPTVTIRADAVRALGELRDPRSTAALVARLADPEVVLRRTVAEALGQLADRRSVDPILGRLAPDGETDPSVRLALVRALGAMRALEAQERLEQLAASTDAPNDFKVACDDALKAINTRDPEFQIPKNLHENPLPSIAEQMDQVEGQLDYYWSGKRTQDKQEQIVKALDDLIKMIEDQQQQGGGGGGGGGGQQGQEQGGSQGGSTPAAADNPSSASAGGDEEHARRRITAIPWGKLPPAVRGELEQALRENLPERYRRLLESYTKALAEAEEGRR